MSSKQEEARATLNTIAGQFSEANGGPLTGVAKILPGRPGEKPRFVFSSARTLTQDEKAVLPTRCNGFDVGYVIDPKEQFASDLILHN
ncbi:MAG: hypothetical protein WBK55_06305 [Alphaproteobacteria bacterium]